MRAGFRAVTGGELMSWSHWELIQLVKAILADRDQVEVRDLVDRVRAYCRSQNQLSTSRRAKPAAMKTTPGYQDARAAERSLRQIADEVDRRNWAGVAAIVDELPEPLLRDAFRLLVFRGRDE